MNIECQSHGSFIKFLNLKSFCAAIFEPTYRTFEVKLLPCFKQVFRITLKLTQVTSWQNLKRQCRLWREYQVFPKSTSNNTKHISQMGQLQTFFDMFWLFIIITTISVFHIFLLVIDNVQLSYPLNKCLMTNIINTRLLFQII